jgi:uncharacterized protein (DUF1697 family)
MTVYAAFLRGINVGGHNILPMQELRNILALLGCNNVATYIQSGNAVFHSGDGPKALQAKITAAIKQVFGFAPRVLLLTNLELQSVLAANPFPAAAETPNLLHVWFFAARARKPDRAALDALRSETERYELAANALYLHAPDGIGRSRLAARVEHCVGVETTDRNWRTVSKVADMARSIS